MNAESLLKQVARALTQCKLEVVMVGNGAAALHGAPVTTLDVDFMFRHTPKNLQRLKQVSRILDATIFRPYYPASNLYRLSGENGLQLDFLTQMHGVKSFASLRSRASKVSFGQFSILVADLADIVRSKEAAGRAQDKAVLPVLKRTLREKAKEK